MHHTIYVDESGDLGFGPNSSKYLVIALLSMARKDGLLRSVKHARSALGVARQDELKGSVLRQHERELVLHAIARCDLSIHAVIVNKAGVRPALRTDPNLLYNYALQFPLVAHIRRAALDSVSLVIDQRTQKVIGGHWEMDYYLKMKLLAEEGLDVALQCSHVDSRNTLGVQAADVVANAIGRHYELGFARGRNIIAHLVEDERRLFFALP
jgi:hypothetical protein